MVEKTLVPTKKYLQTGSHIGSKFKTGGMSKYIFKKRKDGLKVLDVSTIDDKIRTAGSFLSVYEPEKIAIVSRKQYGQTPVKKFAKTTGAKAFLGRFVPGTFTNPTGKEFFEPKILIVTDPSSDKQSIQEAVKIRIPIIALCSTDNSVENIDLIIPINNNGRQSLALVYWLIAREYQKNRGAIKDYDEFNETPESFEFKGSEERPKGHDPRKRPENRFKRDLR